MKILKILVVLAVLAGGAQFVIQHQADAQAAEAAADRFFSDPGFSEDYTAASEWEEVRERNSSDPLQVMLAKQAHGPR